MVNAASHRMRPILLTAAAAMLGMLPIAGEVFWGPMAYAIIGGLASATLLTLLFLPALYVAWFRIPEAPAAATTVEASAAAQVSPPTTRISTGWQAYRFFLRYGVATIRRVSQAFR